MSLASALAIALTITAILVAFIYYATRPGAFEPPTEQTSRRAKWAFCSVFAVAILFADVQLLVSVLRQAATASYLPADGIMLKCDVTVDHDEDGTSYDLDVEYQFDVAGVQHRGTRVRYYSMWSGGWVRRFARHHQPGARVTVFYKPGDPDESVLVREFDGSPLLVLMFLVPFHVITILLLWGLRLEAAGLPRQQISGRSEPVRRETSNGWQVCIASFSPGGAFTWTLGITSFAFFFLVMLTLGASPPLNTMMVLWAVILALTGAAYWHVKRRHQRGDCDLIFDRDEQTFLLPGFFRAKTPVRAADVESVVMADRGDSESGPTFVIMILGRDGSGATRSFRLQEYTNRTEAAQLAGWIRAELPGAGDSTDSPGEEN